MRNQNQSQLQEQKAHQLTLGQFCAKDSPQDEPWLQEARRAFPVHRILFLAILVKLKHDYDKSKSWTRQLQALDAITFTITETHRVKGKPAYRLKISPLQFADQADTVNADAVMFASLRKLFTLIFEHFASREAKLNKKEDAAHSKLYKSMQTSDGALNLIKTATADLKPSDAGTLFAAAPWSPSAASASDEQKTLETISEDQEEFDVPPEVDDTAKPGCRCSVM